MLVTTQQSSAEHVPQTGSCKTVCKTVKHTWLWIVGKPLMEIWRSESPTFFWILFL